MELDQSAFLAAINEGREIEFCFRNEWYFFRAHNAKRMTKYLFSEISNSQLNKTLIFDSTAELLNVKIQNFSLIDVLSNLDDYTIF